MMKFTAGTMTLLFVVAFFTAGLFPAIILTLLAGVSNISTGLHAAEIGSGSSYKALK